MKHHRFKRGYKNVINESVHLNKNSIVGPFAIETSGHGALSGNYFFDDEAYLAVKILIVAAKLHAQGKSFSDLIAGLKLFACRLPNQILKACELTFTIPEHFYFRKIFSSVKILLKGFDHLNLSPLKI